MTTYYVVRADDGDPRVLIRRDPGIERYNGAGAWVPDGYLMRYFGLGGDADDAQVVSLDDVPAIQDRIDQLYRDAAARARSRGA